MNILIYFLDFITSIGSFWAYSLTLVFSAFEGLPLVGLFSPGGIFSALAGFLAKLHILNLFTVLLVAIVGALVGDMIGYLLGKKYGLDFLKKYGKYFFLKNEHHIQKAKSVIVTHPGTSIIFGRFNYLTRSISPFLAGASDVPIIQFLLFDVLGSALWAVAHVFVGYIFGEGFERASKYINSIGLGALILAVVIFYLYRIINKKHHVFKKYHIYTLALNLFSIYVFAKSFEDVIQRESLYHIDQIIHQSIAHLWTPFGIAFFTFITSIGSVIISILIVTAVLIILISRRKWNYTWLVVLSIVSGELSEIIIKAATHVARPAGALVTTEFFSFPSGHTVIVTLIFGLIFHCFREDFKTLSGKIGFFVFNATVIVVVGFSRIYLNAHWLSDVLAGISLGIFWVTFYILLIRTIYLTEGKIIHFFRNAFARLFLKV